MEARGARTLLNKVPEVTVFFWIIKVLCTTVGETFADYLNESLNFGLTKTSIVMTALLAIALFFQFRARQYRPFVYWTSVVLISVVGTLITDNLTDNLGISLKLTTSVFAVALAAVFAWWYSVERTLSIHSIVTTRREAFYWLTILTTFALGTAAGDLVSEAFNLGYSVALALFAAAIAVVWVAGRSGLNAVLTFWAAYVLTRPLGAAIGDYLSQAKTDGGLGLGPTTTSYVFLALILATVGYLAASRADVIRQPS